MAVETGVGWWLAASHRDPTTGQLHGHTWEVTVWWPGKPYRDARVLQEKLRVILGAWDHTVLPDELASGEALAEALGRLIGDCSEVVFARPAERIYARWRAEPSG